ncbi:MAG: hypothetical protein JW793_09885 [Acidobacteria bacterium]|nr:hypothetical protein [Acidobacteriota bacterium]
MKIFLAGIAWLGLLATVLPSILVFAGVMEAPAHKAVMGVGMVLWFAAAPFFMKEKSPP